MKRHFFRMASTIVLIAFLCTSIVPPSYAQGVFVSTLPEPGAMVTASEAFVPVLVKGLVVHPDQPLNFDFIVDSGNDSVDQAVIKEQSERIAKYFLAAVTVPEDQLWVNLSPYEKDRVIEDELGQTVLGRDMLAQDYVLKQLTASLIYPEKDLGKEFWAKIYRAAQEKFGTTDIAVDAFNKVWIMPGKAEVFEKANAVYVTEARMKVMLDSDYVAMSNQKDMAESRASARGLAAQQPAEAQQPAADFSKQILREIIIPAIEKEVNEGRNFAAIRQIYHAAILAKWYRELIQSTLMADAYVGKNRVAGVLSEEKGLKEEIYQRYIAAYKKGAFSLIKEESDAATGEVIPHKYFSGGISDFAMKDAPLTRTVDSAAVERPVGQTFKVGVDMAMKNSSDAADPLVATQNKLRILTAKRNEDELFELAKDAVAFERRGEGWVALKGDESRINPVTLAERGLKIPQYREVWKIASASKRRSDLKKMIESHVQHVGVEKLEALVAQALEIEQSGKNWKLEKTNEWKILNGDAHPRQEYSNIESDASPSDVQVKSVLGSREILRLNNFEEIRFAASVTKITRFLKEDDKPIDETMDETQQVFTVTVDPSDFRLNVFLGNGQIISIFIQKNATYLVSPINNSPIDFYVNASSLPYFNDFSSEESRTTLNNNVKDFVNGGRKNYVEREIDIVRGVIRLEVNPIFIRAVYSALRLKALGDTSGVDILKQFPDLNFGQLLDGDIIMNDLGPDDRFESDQVPDGGLVYIVNPGKKYLDMLFKEPDQPEAAMGSEGIGITGQAFKVGVDMAMHSEIRKYSYWAEFLKKRFIYYLMDKNSEIRLHSAEGLRSLAEGKLISVEGIPVDSLKKLIEGVGVHDNEEPGNSVDGLKALVEGNFINAESAPYVFQALMGGLLGDWEPLSNGSAKALKAMAEGKLISSENVSSLVESLLVHDSSRANAYNTLRLISLAKGNLISTNNVPGVVKVLMQGLLSGNSHVRKNSAEGLTALVKEGLFSAESAPAAAKVLITRLDSNDVNEQVASAEALKAMVEEKLISAESVPAKVKALIRVRQTRDTDERLHIENGLEGFPVGSLKALIGGLNSPDADVRIESAERFVRKISEKKIVRLQDVKRLQELVEGELISAESVPDVVRTFIGGIQTRAVAGSRVWALSSSPSSNAAVIRLSCALGLKALGEGKFISAKNIPAESLRILIEGLSQGSSYDRYESALGLKALADGKLINAESIPRDSLQSLIKDVFQDDPAEQKSAFVLKILAEGKLISAESIPEIVQVLTAPFINDYPWGFFSHEPAISVEILKSLNLSSEKLSIDFNDDSKKNRFFLESIDDGLNRMMLSFIKEGPDKRGQFTNAVEYLHGRLSQYGSLGTQLDRQLADFLISADRHDGAGIDKLITLAREKGIMTGQEFAQAARLENQPRIDAAEKSLGGIDIQNIDVSHKAGSAKIKFNDDALRAVLTNGFNGFTPVIINIAPVASPLVILGLASESQGAEVVSQASQLSGQQAMEAEDPAWREMEPAGV